LETTRQESCPPPIGQEPEVADANEAGRQQVEQEAAQELLDGERQEALLIAARGVSPAEGDLVVGQGDEAMVGDGDAVRVAAQVMENMLRTSERFFAVDDPVLAEELPEEARERLRLGEEPKVAVEAELAIGEGALESCDELASEDAAEHLDRKKEGITWADPARVIEGEPAGGNHAMNMRMMLQFLIPSMEHAEEADVGAEMFGIASDCEERCRAGAEQQIVDDLLVAQGQGRQQVREREDDVNIGRGQQFFTARLDPTVAGVGLTLRTVPVAARVVRDGAIPAAGTLIQMPAESSRAATFDGCQDLTVLAGKPVTAAFDESLPRDTDEIGHLQWRPIPLFVLRRVFLSGGRQRQRIQRTGSGAEMTLRQVQVDGGLFQIAVP